ncbi:hypothetical protein ACN38_g13182, partial [Penicillium nordicum]
KAQSAANNMHACMGDCST